MASKKLNKLQAKFENGNFEFINIETKERKEMDFIKFLDYLSEERAYVYFHEFNLESGAIVQRLFAEGYAYNPTQKAVNKSFNKIDGEDSGSVSMTIRHNNILIYFFNSKRKIDAKICDLRQNDNSCSCMDDLEVITYYMSKYFEEGLNKHTASSDAFSRFKEMTFEDNNQFTSIFPQLAIKRDDFIRRAYFGGWCYLNPKFTNKNIKGETYDVNSLYPSVMLNEILPYGVPLVYHGKPEYNEEYPLSISQIKIDWISLKKGKFPFVINAAETRAEMDNQYISTGSNITCYMTNMEIELLKECYDFGNIEYVFSLSFKACKGLFDGYINYYAEKKKNSTGVERHIAKLMLNSLYGKFGTKIKRNTYSFTLDSNGVEARLHTGEVINKSSMVYTAMAVFITSYGRIKTIQAANANYNNFIYADTDSIHVKTGLFNKVKAIEVDKLELGKWKLERKFSKSKFICLKCYAEYDNKWNYTVAGLDASYIKDIKDFNVGSTIKYLTKGRNKNGYYIKESSFIIGSKLISKGEM